MTDEAHEPPIFVKSSTPSRRLFLANVSTSLGLESKSRIVEIFSPFGEIEKVFADVIFTSTEEKKTCSTSPPTFSYVIFKEIDSAIEAQKKLDNTNIAGLSNRKVGVRFCIEKKRAVAQPLPSPAVDILCSCGCDSDLNGTQLKSNSLMDEKQRKSENECNNNTNTSSSSIVLPPYIPGLIHIKDFVTEKEENELLAFINSRPWDDTTLARRVQHYGLKFDYRTLLVTEHDDAIPIEMEWLLERLVERGVFPEKPNQITVNEYAPGQGISSHVDTHSPFAHCVCSIGLQSDCAMEFIPIPNPHPETSCDNKNINTNDVPETLNIRFRRRHLIGFTGEVRYAYKHGIHSRTTDCFIVSDDECRDEKCVTHKDESENTSKCDIIKNLQNEESNVKRIKKTKEVIVPRNVRISLTFRLCRKIPHCECEYPWACDTQNPKSLSLPTRMLQKLAAEEEAKHSTNVQTLENATKH